MSALPLEQTTLDDAPLDESGSATIGGDSALVARARGKARELRKQGQARVLRFPSENDETTTPMLPARSTRSVALQMWEGVVEDVDENEGVFWARLRGLKGSREDASAELFLSEVSPSDRQLVRPGAIFYWSIGYTDRPSGRSRESVIQFKKLPRWTQRELDRLLEKARELEELVGT